MTWPGAFFLVDLQGLPSFEISYKMFSGEAEESLRVRFCFVLTILQGKVWLIDFNPFGDVTDPLLFTWEELISGRNLKGDCGQGEALEQVRW